MCMFRGRNSGPPVSEPAVKFALITLIASVPTNRARLVRRAPVRRIPSSSQPRLT